MVDEAQSLSEELLEEVRLLSNIETDTDKLLPIILAGQPELAARLEQPALRHLKQRIALRCELQAFDLSASARYVATRLRVAGGSPRDVFTRDAIVAIHEASGGIPADHQRHCVTTHCWQGSRPASARWAAGSLRKCPEIFASMEPATMRTIERPTLPTYGRRRLTPTLRRVWLRASHLEYRRGAGSGRTGRPISASADIPFEGLRTTYIMSRIAEALKKAGMSVGESSVDDPVRHSIRSRRPSIPGRAPHQAENESHTSSPQRAPERRGVVTLPAPGTARMNPATASERLVVSRGADHGALQQYRKLATTLHQFQAEHPLRSILVTSAVSGEGKTLTAANLALTLADSFRRRVLLIDADMRRPSLQGLFGVEGSQGLWKIVVGGRDSVPLVGVTDRLALLPVGRGHGDPVTALTSSPMRQLLDEVVEAFDWVIVDSPPLGLFPDGVLLAKMVDGVVLVIKAQSTPAKAVQRAIADVTPERIVGAVLNQTVKASNVDYGYTPPAAGSG